MSWTDLSKGQGRPGKKGETEGAGVAAGEGSEPTCRVIRAQGSLLGLTGVTQGL